MENRPVVAAPIIENIPPELKERAQWVVWAFEWRVDKQRNGRWTKVPYGAKDYKAASNRPTSWQSFDRAWQLYTSNQGCFDGIGYVFSADDPFVGGDQDHNLSTDSIPPTYAEVSPSGEGIKFIARASGHYGRKTTKGELYSSLRFFTITGRVIPGHEHITECQDAIDTFHASLGGSKEVHDGDAGGGSRAEKAKLIPAEWWDAGRDIMRTKDRNKLLSRLRASALNKTTRKPDTQLALAINGEFRTFHEKYGYVGIIRSDGSIDESQVRAVVAQGIRMRRFTFPEYTALMSHFFAADYLEKHKSKPRWREELAVLWFRSKAPRYDEYTPTEPQPVARGRAGEHTQLLENAYQLLLTFKAGTEAILMVQDLADALGASRRTASGLLAELKEAHRITYRQAGQYGGIVVTFTGMQIEQNLNGHIPHTEDQNNSNGNGTTTAKDTLLHTSGVQIEEKENARSRGSGAVNSTPVSSETTADARPLIDIYITSTVFLPDTTCMPEKRVSLTLEQTVIAAFDALPKSRANEKTGELKKWVVTNRRIVEHVQTEHAERGWKPAAIAFWADKIRKRRKAATFEELKNLKREALEKKAAAARKRIAKAEERAKTDPMPEIRDFYGKLARQLEGGAALLGWELSRRDAQDEARIATEGYSLGEQAEFLELVEREWKPPAPMPRVSLPTAPDVSGLVARLKARKVET